MVSPLKPIRFLSGKRKAQHRVYFIPHGFRKFKKRSSIDNFSPFTKSRRTTVYLQHLWAVLKTHQLSTVKWPDSAVLHSILTLPWFAGLAIQRNTTLRLSTDMIISGIFILSYFLFYWVSYGLPGLISSLNFASSILTVISCSYICPPPNHLKYIFISLLSFLLYLLWSLYCGCCIF